MAEQEVLLHPQPFLETLLRQEQGKTIEGSWEHLVYEQWLNLPQTLAALQEYYPENELQRPPVERSGLRRVPMPLYRHLAILASKDRVRSTFAEEIEARQREKSMALRREIEKGEIRKKVVIVGAGPNGLTVARHLLAKTHNGKMAYNPQDILVIDKRETVGGQFSEQEMMQFELIMDQEIQGDHVVIQPMDILGDVMPRNRRYAEMVAANAYFSDVNIALQTEWTENAGGVSMIIPNHKISHKPCRLFVSLGDKQTHSIAGDAVVFAPGMEDGSYSDFEDAPNTLKKLREEEHKRIWNAGEIHKYLYQMDRRLKDEDVQVRMDAKQEFYELLLHKIAIGGGWKTTELLIKNIQKLYRHIEPLLDAAQREALKGSVVVFRDKSTKKDVEDIIRGSKFPYEYLFAIEEGRLHDGHRVTEDDKALRIVRSLPHSPNQLTDVMVQTIVMTGYKAKRFMHLFSCIQRENGKDVPDYIRTFNQYRRLADWRELQFGWNVFLVGPRLFPDKVERAANGGKPYEQAQLVRDGQFAVRIADVIYREQKRRRTH